MQNLAAWPSPNPDETAGTGEVPYVELVDTLARLKSPPASLVMSASNVPSNPCPKSDSYIGTEILAPDVLLAPVECTWFCWAGLDLLNTYLKPEVETIRCQCCSVLCRAFSA